MVRAQTRQRWWRYSTSLSSSTACRAQTTRRWRASWSTCKVTKRGWPMKSLEVGWKCAGRSSSGRLWVSKLTSSRSKAAAVCLWCSFLHSKCRYAECYTHCPRLCLCSRVETESYHAVALPWPYVLAYSPLSAVFGSEDMQGKGGKLGGGSLSCLSPAQINLPVCVWEVSTDWQGAERNHSKLWIPIESSKTQQTLEYN